ncbi:putative Proteasome subunit alpha type-2-like 13, partial [Homarus americanus]
MMSFSLQMLLAVFTLLTPVVTIAPTTDMVGKMVFWNLEQHFPGCHLVLITTQHSRVSSSIIRHMGVGVAAGVVVEAGWVLSQDQLTQDHLLQGLWEDTRTTCRALILDLTTSNNTNLVLGY